MRPAGPGRQLVLLAALLLAAAPAAGAQDLVPGMFVGSPDGPQELAIYAERTPVGRQPRLRLRHDGERRPGARLVVGVDLASALAR